MNHQLVSFFKIYYYFFNPICLFFLSLGVKNGMKGESGASDDELLSDVLSHYSSASESTSVMEEGTGLYINTDTTYTCRHH